MTCHCVSKAVETGEKNEGTATAFSKVDWITQSEESATEHWFRFSRARYGNTLFFRVRPEGGRPSLKKIDLRQMTLMPLQKDEQGPAIDAIEVAEVRIGPVIFARIQWQTDEPATSLVKYGTELLDRRSRFLPRLTREHEVMLKGLQPGRRYRFQVISKDFYENEAKAQAMDFSTEKSFNRRGERPQRRRIAEPGVEGWRVEAFSSGDDVVLLLSARAPVEAALGIAKDRPSEKSLVGRARQRPENHPKLLEGVDLYIKVCLGCHKNYLENSHPVDVPLKPGMKPPPKYRLWDGRITCNTCHEHHSSEKLYRLRMADRRAFCKGCHRDY